MDLTHLFADLSKLEISLGLPEGFTDDLINQDDWSFIIKSHAIIETSLKHVLITLTDQRLSTLFGRISMSGGPASLLATARSLEAMDNNVLHLIEKISKLRNMAVHNVKYLSFNLEKYFDSCSKNEQKRWAQLIAFSVTNSETQEMIDASLEAIDREPKLALAIAVYSILARALFKLHPDEYRIAIEKVKGSTDVFLIFTILMLVILRASKRNE